MSKSTAKAKITAVFKTNGSQGITGANSQSALTGMLDDVYADLAEKVATPTNGDLIKTDASGNPVDSGITATSVSAHLANTSNPHSVTKAQVGLGNCDNTSDADKPISTATQSALDDKADLYSVFATINTTAELYSVYHEGTLSQDASFSHCSPVFVNKGAYISAKARLDNWTACAIAKTDKTQSFYKGVVLGNNTGEATERCWIADEDCYITCSYRTDLGLVLNVRDAGLDDVAPKNRNPHYSYFGVSIKSTQLQDFRAMFWSNTNIKDETSGSCYVDWGEGAGLQAIVNDDSFKHTYAKVGVYEIALVGLTGITGYNAFTYPSAEGYAPLWAILGDTFINMGTYYMFRATTSPYVKIPCVQFVSMIPVTWNNGYSAQNFNGVNKIIVPKESFVNYCDKWKYNTSTNIYWLVDKLVPSEEIGYIYRDEVVTVGTNGDFTTITDALKFLSQKYPLYKYEGVKAQIKILAGTIITEQILVNAIDLSWIEIVYESYSPNTFDYDSVAEDIADGTIVFDATSGYNSVSVNPSSWTKDGVTHDTRGDLVLFRAENGGRLPIIGCVFKSTVKYVTIEGSKYNICGMCCNRGSEGIVKTLCGFINFGDGVISNNESSVTIREGITLGCSRWGCHARHNGEVSARSVIATGCANDSTYAGEYGAAVADRVADMDVREAYLSGDVAIKASNASTICARGTHILGGGVANTYIIQSDHLSRINATDMSFSNITGEGFRVYEGGMIDAFNVTGNPSFFPANKNTISYNGVIFGN